MLLQQKGLFVFCCLGQAYLIGGLILLYKRGLFGSGFYFCIGKKFFQRGSDFVKGEGLTQERVFFQRGAIMLQQTALFKKGLILLLGRACLIHGLIFLTEEVYFRRCSRDWRILMRGLHFLSSCNSVNFLSYFLLL